MALEYGAEVSLRATAPLSAVHLPRARVGLTAALYVHRTRMGAKYQNGLMTSFPRTRRGTPPTIIRASHESSIRTAMPRLSASQPICIPGGTCLATPSTYPARVRHQQLRHTCAL